MTPGLVCPFGHFEVSCRTLNGTVIAWDVTFPEAIAPDIAKQPISLNDSQSEQSTVISDSSVLLISITSLSPFTSLLEINNTITALNGTTINCTSIDGTDSLVLTVIGNGKIPAKA